jgi:hypothetical protein
MFSRVDFLLHRVGTLKIDNHIRKTLISGHPFVKIPTFSHPIVPID